MKATAGFFLACLLAATPASALAADLSGTWNVSGTIQLPGGGLFTATPTCVFQQAGSKLTGTCKGPNAIGPATGTVHGRGVNWRWAATPYSVVGVGGISTFTGRMGRDGVIRGSLVFSRIKGPVGAFTQQRQ